mgnify:CR=1 FL=1
MIELLQTIRHNINSFQYKQQEGVLLMKETEWKSIIKECEASGIPASEWCKGKSYNIRAYYYWKNKMNKKETAVQWQKLKPISLAKDPKEIQLKYGKWTIKIEEGFSQDLLIKVIKAVNSIC